MGDQIILHKGTVLGGKWIIQSKLGEGRCGIVYTVTSQASEGQSSSSSSSGPISFVAKCIPYGKNIKEKKKRLEQEGISNTLNRERDLLAPGKLLSTFPYRPALPPSSYHGKDETAGVMFLVMEKLDNTLLDWFSKKTASAMSVSAAVGSVGLQLLAGLRFLHEKSWLFVDIKPDNFMTRRDNVVFIDCK